MNIQLKPSHLTGCLSAVTSKSHAHRAMICAALSDRPTELHITKVSQDIEVTAECLNALGATVSLEEKGLARVTPAGRNRKQAILDCKESGSTLRFLLPVAAAITDKSIVTGRGRLPERPLGPLVEAMEAHGCRFVGTKLPLTVTGRLKSGQFSLPGNISSQFISGILLALPLIGGGEVALTTHIESLGYLCMTIETMAQFGVVVEQGLSWYRVPPHAKYHSPLSLSVEGDWSNAAVWLAVAAMSGEISLTGLSYDSTQADKEIVTLLREAGANVEIQGGRITAMPTAHNRLPSVIDATHIPDLVPILTVLALHKKGETKITNASRLRLKESDRLTSLTQELRKLGALIEEMPDGLVIQGKGCLLGGEADGCGDHRIVMALAAASVLCEKPVSIAGAETIAKSYPTFFEDYAHLGGQLITDDATIR